MPEWRSDQLRRLRRALSSAKPPERSPNAAGTETTASTVAYAAKATGKRLNKRTSSAEAQPIDQNDATAGHRTGYAINGVGNNELPR